MCCLRAACTFTYIYIQVYLETVPMPSMEVYSGKPQDKDKVVHFEDWMQTTYHGVTAELANWPGMSKDEKAKLFLGKLNEYFVQRERLLGDDESYLFPRDRPSKDALKVENTSCLLHILLHMWHRHILVSIEHMCRGLTAAGSSCCIEFVLLTYL